MRGCNKRISMADKERPIWSTCGKYFKNNLSHSQHLRNSYLHPLYDRETFASLQRRGIGTVLRTPLSRRMSQPTMGNQRSRVAAPAVVAKSPFPTLHSMRSIQKRTQMATVLSLRNAVARDSRSSRLWNSISVTRGSIGRANNPVLVPMLPGVVRALLKIPVPAIQMTVMVILCPAKIQGFRYAGHQSYHHPSHTGPFSYSDKGNPRCRKGPLRFQYQHPIWMIQNHSKPQRTRIPLH